MEWDAATVATIQTVLDTSANGSVLIRKSSGNPRWRLSAVEALDAWGNAAALPICTVATVGKNGKPHVALVHAGFDGVEILMRVYENAIRRRDLAANPAIGLTRYLPDRTMLTVHGRASEIPDSRWQDPDPLGDGSWTVQFRIQVDRMYAIRPRLPES